MGNKADTNCNKHNAELQQTDTGTNDTSEFSTFRISHANVPKQLKSDPLGPWHEIGVSCYSWVETLK